MTDIYQSGISNIVTDYARQYNERPEYIRDLFEKYVSPVSIMLEFYRMMINQKEIKPIEDYVFKQQIWDEVKNMDCDRSKKIKIAKSIYVIKMILK